jgi:tryptophan synthase alpha chain
VTTGLERIAARFAALKKKNQAGFVAYVMAGDPDLATTAAILDGLPGAGVDIVELGFPFSDPMADGPSIQRAGQRALKSGATLRKTIALAAGFRAKHPDTPLILMGYLNPVEAMGETGFAEKAKAAGIDGAIIVDLPPEEDQDLQKIFADHGLALIRLAAPTSDEQRMNTILSGAHGFLYYVSVTGVTGVKAVATDAAAKAVARVRGLTDLPVAVGFGVRTPEQAAAMAVGADAVVVGSAIVDAIEQGSVKSPQNAAAQALDLVRRLSEATHKARAT